MTRRSRSPMVVQDHQGSLSVNNKKFAISHKGLNFTKDVEGNISLKSSEIFHSYFSFNF